MTAAVAHAPRVAQSRPRSAKAYVRQVRLITGLTMYTFVASHFINHALGNVSLHAMEAGASVFEFVWRGWVGTLALYAAITIHLGLGLWALYERRYFHISAGQVVQLVLGLSIPFLLLDHVIATRVGSAFTETDLHYPQVLWVLWVNHPMAGLKQAFALLVAWTHGSIGVYYWLRLKKTFRTVAPLLFAVVVLLPILALLGFVQGARQVEVMAADPMWLRMTLEDGHVLDQTSIGLLSQIVEATRDGLLVAIALVLAARGARVLLEQRRGIVRITWPDGRVLRAPTGMSVLDAARRARLPHAAVCGGRGRCSTCRVRVLSGLDTQPPPSATERAVLARVGADVHTRLACQLQPTGDITIVPLLPATATAADGHAKSRYRAGQERFVAILFCDMRGSTPIAEKRLPYDIVFLLNRFFETIGSAVLASGGFPNQFIGDSVMALFGLEVSPEEGCRQALAAARAIAQKLDELNKLLADDLPMPVRIGIGIHAGTAIVGEMGYRETSTITAVGDPVHVAARLQELTKTYTCQLVVSDVVGEHAKIDLSGFARHEIQVRGRQEPLAIRTLETAHDLPA
ncbi:MAG: adenylate/guanylate cyclase domain-containing protein [Alphaproteobacteria bacterium]|nr:adenylate/guanylate cyclase domain-containing protein [Alphaproteobacteria bacterium]